MSEPQVSEQIIVDKANVVFGEYHRALSSWHLFKFSLEEMPEANRDLLIEGLHNHNCAEAHARIHGILLEDVILTIARLTDKDADVYSVIQLESDVCKKFGTTNRKAAKEMSVALRALKASTEKDSLRDYRNNYLGHRLRKEFAEYPYIVDDTRATLDKIEQVLSNIHIVLGGNGKLNPPKNSKTAAQNFWKCVLTGVSLNA